MYSVSRIRNRFVRRFGAPPPRPERVKSIIRRGRRGPDAAGRALLVLIPVLTSIGCREQTPVVVVYCSVDETFAKPLFDAFERQSGVAVRAVTDHEAGKTTGLLQRILAEGDRPRADVLFSGEWYGTLTLAERGKLEPFKPETLEGIPAEYLDRDHRWTAVSQRARVLAFDGALVSGSDLPRSWKELGDARWAAHLAMANPLFGTTRSHVAAMFAAWGDDEAMRFLKSLHKNGAMIVDGNSAAVRAVLDGRARWCMTDMDDVFAARREGNETLEMILPDMGHGDTLWIPCTVGLIRSGPNPAAGRRLVSFLVSGEAERSMAAGDGRFIPVRTALRHGSVVPHAPPMDPSKIAAALSRSDRGVRDELLR